MKRHQSVLGVLGVSLVLTGVLVLWGWEREKTPEQAKAVTAKSTGGNALTPWRQKTRPKSAPAPVADPLREKIALALETAEAESDRKKGEELLRQSFLDIAAADIPNALALLQNESPTELSAALQFFLLRKWAQNDPIAAEDWIRGMPEGDVREKALDVVASEWADRQSRQQSFLLRQMVESDPSAAVDSISRMFAGDRRQEALNVMAIRLANQSFLGAMAWARELPENDERQNALLIAASSVAATAPKEALTVAAELAANAGRDDLITYAASRWAADAGEAAAEWAKQIADAELRERVLAGIAVSWCERDPLAATMLAITTLKTGPQLDDAIVGIVERWVQIEPRAVIEWVSEFPEGQLRERASAFLPAQRSNEN